MIRGGKGEVSESRRLGHFDRLCPLYSAGVPAFPPRWVNYSKGEQSTFFGGLQRDSNTNEADQSPPKTEQRVKRFI